MLSPPQDTIWIEKPGNPNFMIPIGMNNDNVVKKEKEEDEIKKEVKTEDFQKIEQTYAHALYESLQPLYVVISMIESESGKTIFYRFADGNLTLLQKMIPIQWGRSKNKYDFKDNNKSILGETVVNKLIDEDYDNIWDNLEETAFRFILGPSTFGALKMSALELGFPLKPLLSSPAVNHMFSQFVARKFISPKSNAYASGISNGKMQYRLSSGFNGALMSNTKWLMGCRLWFQKVYFEDKDEKVLVYKG